MAAVNKDKSNAAGQNDAATKEPEKAPQTTATKEPEKAPQVTATAKVKGLRVIASKDGFRRGGRDWHGTTEVRIDELTKEQVKQLLDEPRLAVQEIEIEV